jgi:hypothetical protein
LAGALARGVTAVNEDAARPAGALGKALLATGCWAKSMVGIAKPMQAAEARKRNKAFFMSGRP